ncbi:MAG: RNA polymerase subunit sigma [Chloroflexi bacterium]|nr:MAG: RNA polymerase subunit sigma [Chloroflexota bacterium]
MVNSHHTLIKQAQKILKETKYLAALTGAGISTRSGIPDFRSPESGLWDHVDPMEVATITAFKQNPKAFFDWIKPLARKIMSAQPNPAHLALANMEKYGPLKGIITQNIDVLHTKAGSQTIYEVHGHMRDATCMHCLETSRSTENLHRYLSNGDVPRCFQCNGILKPNIILFGEILPMMVLNKAKRLTQSCDAMIVAGSSLEVAPAGDLPLLAKYAGAKLIIVNYEETHLDYLADVVIHADVAEVLPQLASVFMSEPAD